jgi:hypothetical protein
VRADAGARASTTPEDCDEELECRAVARLHPASVSSHAAGAGDDNLNGQKSVRRTLTNLPAQAINCDDGDRAARSSRRRSASRVTTLQQLLPENPAR